MEKETRIRVCYETTLGDSFDDDVRHGLYNDVKVEVRTDG